MLWIWAFTPYSQVFDDVWYIVKEKKDTERAALEIWNENGKFEMKIAKIYFSKNGSTSTF